MDNQELVKFLKSSDTQSKVGQLTLQMNKAFGLKWFTIGDCYEVFKDSPDNIHAALNCLYICGILLYKKEKYRLSSNKLNLIINGPNN